MRTLILGGTGTIIIDMICFRPDGTLGRKG